MSQKLLIILYPSYNANDPTHIKLFLVLISKLHLKSDKQLLVWSNTKLQFKKNNTVIILSVVLVHDYKNIFVIAFF